MLLILILLKFVFKNFKKTTVQVHTRTMSNAPLSYCFMDDTLVKMMPFFHQRSDAAGIPRFLLHQSAEFGPPLNESSCLTGNFFRNFVVL